MADSHFSDYRIEMIAIVGLLLYVRPNNVREQGQCMNESSLYLDLVT